MALRLLVALALGALVGLERELVGKEAGVRTGMMVAGGAAIFCIISLSAPGIIGIASASGAALNIIANVVVGIGFLGAGAIIKNDQRAHGLTTAAVIWATASVGLLAGMGLIGFAAFAAVLFTVLLYFLRKTGIKQVKD